MTNHFILTREDSALREKLQKAADDAVSILSNCLDRYASGDVYPAVYADGQYLPVKNADLRNNAWLEGFWTGQLWLAYEHSADEKFRGVAEKNVVDFAKRMEENNQIDWHHDTGFLYTPSCVAAYRLTGNETAKNAALCAAYSLSRRFRPRGNFIQSMSYENDAKNYKFIIDTMLNLPLLFWAAEVTGNDERYRDKAIRHAETTRKYIIRGDHSTYHHFMMDRATGEPVRGLTWQGYSDESCWTRGQGWMIYGSALMYTYTGDKSWIDTFEQVTDYFIDRLSEDDTPLWDFAVLGTDDDTRDTSAAAIAVCGIMELARHIPADSGKMPKYLSAAKRMLTSLVDNYAVKPEAGTEGLLTGACGAKPQNMVRPCEPFGDYFYLEALIRALNDWKMYW